MEPAHWAQGSSVMYIVASGSRSSPTFWSARCNASSSAWAVGSRRCTVSLYASANTSPSAITTAPTGTSSRTEAARANRRAASIPARSLGDGVPLRTGHLGNCGRRGIQPPEREPVAVPLHPDGIALVEVPLQQLQRDRILQQPLDHPLERTSAVYRIVALLGEQR